MVEIPNWLGLWFLLHLMYLTWRSYGLENEINKLKSESKGTV